ncbi:L-aspartate oxidase [Psychrobacter aestuarii]|uniref:L-aspartate oxidase n=1 Tax=Psychrobacter aestuarii TaxID=556327 RepID=A0ABP3FNF8_9GAMM|nr:L-aspartate oxidase [Psychrobacter aestuarii]
MSKPTNTIDATSTVPAMSADAMQHTDVLIIGAGLAGLSAALSLPKHLNITVLSKSALEVCSSHYAQGGIAASLDKNDSVHAHVADTLIAGAALCDVDNTQRILSAGQAAIEWLCAQGVPFTQEPTSTDVTGSNALHLTKEGGHGCRRVAHAEDATGRYVMQTLIAKAQAADNITLLPYHEALSLLTTDTPAGTRCCGAHVYASHNDTVMSIHSAAVILASGGLGQMFARASAPDVCIGDGVMMAWQAGCRLANLEFVQFHPTGLALADSSFLISEALRGEGAHLYCPNTGKRFMPDYDARAELAPRDIVARAIATEIQNNGLGYVHLNISHLPAEFITAHFPQIYQTLLTHGIDITRDPIPVAPTAHYSCGGVVADTDGMTDVQGLYAAGEVAYTGLHGANRLASNSLLECVVVGRNIAAHLPQYLAHQTRWQAPSVDNILPITLPNNVAKKSKAKQSTNRQNTHTRFTDSQFPESVANVAGALKQLMSRNMGITRTEAGLSEALQQVRSWQDDVQQGINNASNLSISEKIAYQRIQRQLSLAALMLQSARLRCESRGGHTRLDFPMSNDTAAVSVIAPIAPNVGSSLSYQPLPQIAAIPASYALRPAC